MSAEKPVTFGKRDQRTIQSVAELRSPLRKGFVLAVAGAIVALLAAFALMIATQGQGGPSGVTKDLVSAAATPSLTGVWAANAENCDVARMKIELDGTTLTSVSALGRIPIGRYTLSGSNPVTLTFPNGDHIVWDATYDDKLIPIAISPENGAGRLEMMHLTRC